MVNKRKGKYMEKREENCNNECEWNWTPVSEKRPPEMKNKHTMDYAEFICTVDFGEAGKDVRVYKYGKGHFHYGPETIDDIVTAWMPLPKPWSGSPDASEAVRSDCAEGVSVNLIQDINTKIAQNINEQLVRHGMTQKELATKSNMTEVNVSRYCSGARMPKATAIYAMAKAFGCTMEELMKGVDYSGE